MPPRYLVGKEKGQSPLKDPGPVKVLRIPVSLGAILQDEGDLKIDLVADDIAVLDHDVHVLDPGALYVAQGLLA